MLQEALYERQNLIRGLQIPEVGTVVGLGGTGFWTAVFLAMSGVKELILIDSDMVEVSNLNRLPLKEEFVGKKKTAGAKEFIKEIRKVTRIETHDLRIKKPADCQILRGSVFCCTDNLQSQQIVCAFCKKNNLPYQRIGYDGTILNVSKTFPLSFEEIKEDGYTVTPSWVIPAVFAAAAGVASRIYKELCLMDDLGKLHIQNSSHVPEKILDEAKQEREDEIINNIDDYIPDRYGCCDDCDRIDPDNNSEYGYCPECKEHYTESDIEDIKEAARQERLDEIVEQIKSGDIKDANLQKALDELENAKEVTNARS